MKYLFSLLFLCLNLWAHAQKNRENLGEISGTLIDASHHTPLVYATVSVYSASDTVLLAYKLSDEKGQFKLSGLPLTKLRIVITSMGYSILRHSLSLDQDHRIASLGNMMMSASSVNLDEVIIHAERPPVMVRKDTIEFNAAAFKTLPDALVEDLLKKLPGVSVDKNGNIMVNGRSVSTIYVDGKDFFGGDVRIASKNLPANIIDRIQVSTDQEVLRNNPLMAEADIPQIINLKLKPGIKKGIFGKMYGGGGITDKYEAGALLNLFRDTTQISLLGYANNLNKAAFAFTDLRSIGGFGRSSWGNANGNGNGGLSIDNVSFGGFGSGLMRSIGGGANFNTIIRKKVAFNLNYFYGEVRSNYDELKNTRQILGDTLFSTRQNLKQSAGNYAHMLSSGVEFKLNEKLRLNWKNTIVFNQDQTLNNYDIRSSSDLLGLLNTSINQQDNQHHGTTWHSWLRLTPTFTKKGRSMSVSNVTLFENTDANLFNQVNSVFYLPTSGSSLRQLRENGIINGSNLLILNYSDLLKENLRFAISSFSTYLFNQNNVSSFLIDLMKNYMPLPSATEDFSRSAIRNESSASLQWKQKKFSITPTLGIGLFYAENHFSKAAPVNQRFTFFLPSIEVGQGAFSLSYQTRFTEPNMLNLQPVPDNSNPLFIRYGNPQLKPAYNQYISFNVRKYDTKRALTYNAGLQTNFVNRAAVVARTLNNAGLQTTMPVNVDGVRIYSGVFLIQKDWKMAGNRQISLLLSGNSSLSRTLVLLNNVRSDAEIVNLKPSAEIRFNLNDKLEFNQAFAFSRSTSAYESPAFTGWRFNTHDLKTDLIFRPGKFVLESTMDYRYNGNQIPGLLKSYYKWNAGITYLFLSGSRGQLKFAVNDILDQNVIAQRMVSENSVSDMQGSTIRRYATLTFTYNIRNFGEKIGGRNKLF